MPHPFGGCDLLPIPVALRKMAANIMKKRLTEEEIEELD